ncbi:MAG: hypothetical protein AAGL97_09420, partial [Pseudomonadota bacterium]
MFFIAKILARIISNIEGFGDVVGPGRDPRSRAKQKYQPRCNESKETFVAPDECKIVLDPSLSSDGGGSHAP